MPKQMVKSTIFAVCVLVILLALLSSSANAQGGQAQVWGFEGSAAGYSGQDAYLTTPNPNIGVGHWTGGPNGVSNFDDTWMESGPTKACDLDCGLHPYGSWHNRMGNGLENVDQTLWLAAGGEYQYDVFNGIDGKPNKWRAFFCSGAGCFTMVTGNLRTSNLPHVASGGESDSAGVHWGDIRTRFNEFKDAVSGNWFSWCWQYIRNNVNGTLSACDPNQHRWTASY